MKNLILIGSIYLSGIFASYNYCKFDIKEITKNLTI